MALVDSALHSPTYRWPNLNDVALPALGAVNLLIILRILYREEHITPSLGIDLAAHALTVASALTSNQLIRIANVSTNSLRALAFLYGAAEAPLGTPFGLFAVGIHAVNVVAAIRR